MGSLFRSKRMCLSQLFVQNEAAYECISSLGELGLTQFKDMNAGTNAFHRKYINDVRRCEELLRKLRYFEMEMDKQKIKYADVDSAADEPAPDVTALSKMEDEFERLMQEFKEITSNATTMQKHRGQLLEVREVLRGLNAIFEQNGGVNMGDTFDGDDRGGQLGYVCGAIPRAKVPSFERLLWRACRGMVFVRHIAIAEALVDVSTGEIVEKDVIVIFFQGNQLRARVEKICDGFEVSRHNVEEDETIRKKELANIGSRLTEVNSVIDITQTHLCQSLSKVAVHIATWKVQVSKMMAIFHTMNKFATDPARKSLSAQVWCPFDQVGRVREALFRGAERSGTGAQPILNIVETKETHPTYHEVNKYTSAFQGLVDAYGVANYQEVNPAPFTIITFPFLFAVMFGDWGHGIIMSLAAGLLCYKEESFAKLKGLGEVWESMFGGRYIILLMGLFSIYTGFIYNDCFSKAISFVPSGWTLPPYPGPTQTEVELEPHENFNYAWPLGIDPIWAISENMLTFSNSYKMKMAVILGVIQMSFGVCLSYKNASFFKSKIDIWFQFVPQILFLMCIFGYLCVMIIFKWLSSSFPGGNPPSLLLMLINMFLKFSSNPQGGEVLYGAADGSTQGGLQRALVVIAVLCVPWMLLVKPLYLDYKKTGQLSFCCKCVLVCSVAGIPWVVYKSLIASSTLSVTYANIPGSSGSRSSLTDDTDSEDRPFVKDDDSHSEGDHEEHTFADLFVHQAIHTIEYCLGCISNTASYLRLWALSLAHSQLSEVLWSLVLSTGFKGSAAMLYCTFAAWAIATVVVLLIMEGLSAFLHALRLHWVEFQNKFYGGVGLQFTPFAFSSILKGEVEE